MNIKFPTEEEFADLVKSNCIDNGAISADGINFILNQKTLYYLILKFGNKVVIHQEVRIIN